MQDVEAVISEYDTDVGSKESEYQAALGEYNEVGGWVGEWAQGGPGPGVRLTAQRGGGRESQETIFSLHDHVTCHAQRVCAVVLVASLTSSLNSCQCWEW